MSTEVQKTVVNIEVEIKDRAKKFAKKDRRTFGSVVNIALDEYLKRMEGKEVNNHDEEM